jgi:hypothetical protein
LKLALFKRLLQLLEIAAQQLHHQIIIIGIRAVRKETREANPPVFGRWLGLLLLEACVECDNFRVLIVDAIFLQGSFLGKLHHVLHKRYLPLELGLVFA